MHKTYARTGFRYGLLKIKGFIMNKLTLKPIFMFTALAFLLTSTATWADHIDGHEACDPIFPCPLPGEEFFTGGVMWVTLIGPIEDSIITGTTFDITWVSDGATPASDLEMHGTVMVDKNFVEFMVTGEDLGFGSGPGTFKGTFSTDALNGLVWPSFLLPPYSVVDLQIDAVNGGGIQGVSYFVDSFIKFDVVEPGCPAACPADLDGDTTVGTSDMLILFAQWDTDGPADLDGDGSVSTSDLLILFANWGPCS